MVKKLEGKLLEGKLPFDDLIRLAEKTEKWEKAPLSKRLPGIELLPEKWLLPCGYYDYHYDYDWDEEIGTYLFRGRLDELQTEIIHMHYIHYLIDCLHDDKDDIEEDDIFIISASLGEVSLGKYTEVILGKYKDVCLGRYTEVILGKYTDNKVRKLYESVKMNYEAREQKEKENKIKVAIKKAKDLLK